MISLGSVSLTYDSKGGSTRVLNELDLEIARGERIAILGLSGSGKSSLIGLISGDLSPEPTVEGSVAVPPHLVVHVIPQNPFEAFHSMRRLEWHLREALGASGIENVSLAREVAQVGSSLFSDFNSILGKYPDEVSGGELMRFNILIGILRKADILLADEPTGSLDSATALEVADLLVSAASITGASLILATHDLTVAQEACEAALVLDQGRVRFHGEIGPAIEHYRATWKGIGPTVFRRFEGEPKTLVGLKDAYLTRRGDAFTLKVEEFSVNSGARVAITGRSGSGKSTLIKSLFDKSIRISGKKSFTLGARGPKSSRAKLGLVFQDTWSTLNPNHTVKRILGEGIGLASQVASVSNMIDLLARAGLDSEHLTRKPTELSGGQRQRVAVLRALLQEPALLAMDEPTSHLDPESSQRVWSLVSELMDSSCALVVASHNPEEIRPWATNTFQIKDGGLTSA